MDPGAHFSATYAQARVRFIAAARARNLTVETHVLPDRLGIDGEELATDVALLGTPDARSLLILTSATHGIEGFCGSGCQVALLRDDAFVADLARANVAVLFIHAVNPHGFSYGRRVNEDNADLNRNFRDFAQPAPSNPAYAEVHPLLLPATWPPPAENEQRIGEYVAARGMRAFQSAVTGGQYTHPDGLFYGGARPAWSNRTVREVLRTRAAAFARIAWIDFHTGLGARGHGEKIHAGRDLATDLARARLYWGTQVTSFHDGSSTSAVVTGVLTLSGYEECRNAELTAMALEYGTIPLGEVLQALRADHWLHNHPDAPIELRTQIAGEMRAAFYGDDDEWKATVYRQARESALDAVRHLAADAS